MSYCTPCPPCDTNFPLLCEPLETTANGKRLVVEDSAACQKTIQSPVAQQILKTDGAGNLTWTNGVNSTVLGKDSTGKVEFATLNSVLQSGPVDLGIQPLTTTGAINSGAITTSGSVISKNFKTIGTGSDNNITFINTSNTIGMLGMRLAFDSDRMTFQRASDSGAFEANYVSINQDDGNVGIGTTSPTQKLDVNGDVKCNTLTAAQNTITAGLTKIGLIGSATNVGMGAFSPLGKNTTGGANTALGVATLIEVITGSNNTAVGANALQNTTGNQNTGCGQQALKANTTGNLNTAVGSLAANIQTNFDNSGAFGYNAQPTGSNTIRIGNSSVTSVTCQTNAWSDERDKTEIRDTILGLDFIKSLRPVDYKWDFREDYRELPPESPAIDATENEIAKYKQDLEKWREDSQLKNLVRDGSKKRTRFHHGLIAQEVKTLIESTGVDFGGFQDSTIKGGDDVMTIGYQELIAPMIKAIQELSAKVAILESK